MTTVAATNFRQSLTPVHVQCPERSTDALTWIILESSGSLAEAPANQMTREIEGASSCIDSPVVQTIKLSSPALTFSATIDDIFATVQAKG